MPAQTTAIVTLLSIALSGAATRVERMAGDIENEPNRVSMTIVESKVTEETLEIHYRITNGLERDIWICESILSSLWGGMDYEVCLPEGSQTLIIRRRLSVPGIWGMEFAVPPNVIYRRLLAGEQRSESIVLPLPIRPAPVFFPRPDLEKTLYPEHLRMEIGFHESNLPEEVFDIFGTSARHYEAMRDTDCIVVFPYDTRRLVERERLLWATPDVSRIAYAGKAMHSFPYPEWPKPPDLASCTRVTVEYHPSMLEYFFPGVEEQSLLSHDEKEYLRSQKTTCADRPEQIDALRDDIRRGQWSLVVAEEARANVSCYTNDKLLTSFTVFGDRRLLMSDGLQFMYARPLASLRSLAPQIKPYKRRAQRARDLKNSWYEIRLFHKRAAPVAADSSGKSAIRYPPASQWNDALREAYRRPGGQNPVGDVYREGACEYAMNPDCEPNSPADTVLLFETQVGWNRHGGPELFTFDNHDPCGGLVLLNDGTVRFIRTEEELKQLRWT
jgi:hypothetical protein